LKVVVVGGGIAGVTAAETIRNLDDECEIILVSEEPPLYSPCVFHLCLSGELDPGRAFIETVNSLQKKNISFLKEKVVKIDKDQKKIYLSNGTAVSYDKLILATGSYPVIPPIDGVKKDLVFTFKTFKDFQKIYEITRKKPGGSAVIIGGGVIGVEVAYALKNIGWTVYIIEVLERVLPRLLDPELALRVKSLLEANGIHVFTGEKVLRIIETKEKTYTVITDRRAIGCDIVILVTGMRPRIELAKEIGIELGPSGGIKVNPYMMTNVNDIFACGDCVEVEDLASGKSKLSLLWHVAKLQGYIAGLNCIGVQRKFPGALNLTITNLLGTYIISNGNTLDDFKGEKTNILEKKDEENYLRIILVDGKVVSLQFVGKNPGTEYFGIMLGTMRRAKELEMLQKIQEIAKKEKIIKRANPLLLYTPLSPGILS